MKKVLMSGASSGIGKAIKSVLIAEKYDVYNVGRENADIVCDFNDLQSLENRVKEWLRKNEIDVLINCAGVGIFEPHETLNFLKIQNMININLTAPILLTNICLKSLMKRQGHIVNIASVEATRHSKYSALYTATKSGLRDFSLSLFEEVRKNGVRVTSINPDITKTSFFDNLNFTTSDNEERYLLPQTIAYAVKDILNIKGVVTDFTIRPQKFEIKRKTPKL